MSQELKPHMTVSEARMLRECMKNGVLYLEFGCGGSTVLAAESNVRKIYVVDTHPEWIIKCQQHPAVAQRIAKKEAFIFFLDVGRLKRWGKPATTEKRIVWPAYSSGIWLELPELPDVILVDGRWRVACALQALWRCADSARILVHDWDTREQYHQLLEFADIEDKTEKLVSLAPKPERDRSLIAMRALEQVGDYS